MSVISEAVQVQMNDYLQNGTPFPEDWGIRTYPFNWSDNALGFTHMIDWVNESLKERNVLFQISISEDLSEMTKGHPVTQAVMLMRQMNDRWKLLNIPAEFIALEEIIGKPQHHDQVRFSFRWEDKEY